MKPSSVHPVPLLIFLSVLTLILAFQIFLHSGAALFLLAAFGFAATTGWIIGRFWSIYPWQVGFLGAIPSIVFIIWRFYSQETMQEEVDNVSLFLFHPLIVAISGHFGALIGRWQALRSRTGGSRKPEGKPGTDD